MKICIVHRYPISLLKTSNFAFQPFIEELVNYGNEIYFVSFKEEVPINYPFSDISCKQINISFNRGKKDSMLKNILFILLVPFVIRKLHSKNHFNLIYCDDSLPFYGFFIKLIVNTIVIVRLGDLQTGYLLGNGKKKRIYLKIILPFEKSLFKKADKLVAISESFKDYLIDQGIPKNKICVVEENVDIEKFNPNVDGKNIRDKYNINQKTPIIMSHGLIVPWKGLDVLLKAVPMVLKHAPNAKFMIIGDGPSLNSLKNMARKLHIEDSIIFTGWIPYQDIPKYLAACNIGVAMRSGNFANNFVITTALLQYLAVCKPVVAPKLNAVSKVIENGKNGLLFKIDDPYELSEKIIYLIKNPKEAERLGENGLLLVGERFDKKVIGAQIAKILNDYDQNGKMKKLI